MWMVERNSFPLEAPVLGDGAQYQQDAQTHFPGSLQRAAWCGGKSTGCHPGLMSGPEKIVSPLWASLSSSELVVLN